MSNLEYLGYLKNIKLGYKLKFLTIPDWFRSLKTQRRSSEDKTSLQEKTSLVVYGSFTSSGDTEELNGYTDFEKKN